MRAVVAQSEKAPVVRAAEFETLRLKLVEPRETGNYFIGRRLGENRLLRGPK